MDLISGNFMPMMFLYIIFINKLYIYFNFIIHIIYAEGVYQFNRDGMNRVIERYFTNNSNEFYINYLPRVQAEYGT